MQQNIKSHIAARLALATASICGSLMVGVSQASAASFAPYTQAAFDTAIADHTPVVIHIEASWCPVCKQQQAILESLNLDPRYAKLEILDVNFDTQKPVVRQFGANMQSTLIAYHDGKPAQRAVGITSEDAISGLLDTAVGN